MRKFLSCVALLFNLAATGLLYYAFPVTSQIGDTRAKLASGETVALIPSEHPCFVPVGFTFLAVGFLIQFALEFFPQSKSE